MGMLGSPLSVHGLGPKPGEISQHEVPQLHAAHAASPHAAHEIDLQPSAAAAAGSTLQPMHAPQSPAVPFQGTLAAAPPGVCNPMHVADALPQAASAPSADSDPNLVLALIRACMQGRCPSRGLHLQRVLDLRNVPQQHLLRKTLAGPYCVPRQRVQQRSKRGFSCPCPPRQHLSNPPHCTQWLPVCRGPHP